MKFWHIVSSMSMFENDDERGINRWWVRRLLKTISGILLALALWGPVMVFAGFAARWYPPDSFLLGMSGIIVLYAYYTLHTEYKEKVQEEETGYTPIGH